MMIARLLSARRPEPGGWWDAFAVGASAACLFHCLGLPLLFALVPAATNLLGIPDGFHVAAFALAVPASAIAMRRGYRHHGTALPLLIGAVGLGLLGLGALCGFGLAVETGLTLSRSVVLAIAHLRNWRLQRAVQGRRRAILLAESGALAECERG